MSTARIKQGVAKVVKTDKSFFWIRISRAYMSSLANYWQKQPNFYYMKIYEFDRQTRKVGAQLGYITQNNWELFY